MTRSLRVLQQVCEFYIYIFNIQSFDQLYDIAKERKGTDYNQYLGIHLDYLYGFLRRVKTLLDLNVELNIITADFDEKFEKGEFSGWPRETGGALTHTGVHLDLSAFLCPEELAVEWRHAHGMRCLGIPNTAHFANVTQIEDAMSLWEKLKVQRYEEAWKSQHEEEFEDSKPNWP